MVYMCCLSLTAQGPNFSDIHRFERAIVVGTPTDSYPLSYLASDNHCEGFSVELLDATARVMSIKIRRIQAPASRLMELFRKGDLDMMQVLSPGPGREAYADFSVHYMDLQGGYFVRENETRYKTPFDLNNAVVAIPGYNSIGEKFFRDNGVTARLVHTRSLEESLIELNSGLHDAAFGARLSALAHIEHLQLKNLRPLGQPLVGYNVRHCFAVRKGDANLLARLNEGLAILNRTGEYEVIYSKWFGRFDAPLINREKVVIYVASGLAVALCLATLALFRQQTLRHRLARQSRQISENEAILAEAQRIAHLGSWQYDLTSKKLTCSPEALRIIERDQRRGAPSYFRLLSLMPRAERTLVHRSITGALLDGIACDVTIPFQTGPLTIKNLHITARPIRNANGNIDGLFGTVQDITRQKVAEEGLRAREQLLRALYENVPTAMGVVEDVGSSFRFVSANPSTARLLGLHTTSLANRILAELPLPTAIVDYWTDWFRQGSKQNEIFKTEYFHEISRHHYAITLVPLGNETDSHRQLCFLIDDITERKEIDSEIAQGRRLRAIGELVGGIAHEFNNLLTPIMLKTEILALEWSKNPRLLDELQTIAHAAKRGADLTRRLLTFGRKSDTHIEEVRVHAIVRANFDLLGQTIDRRISLKISVPETLSPVFLNPTELHQIVLNLLLNARDTLMEKLASDASNTWTAQINVEATELSSTSVDSNPPMAVQTPASWLRLTVRDNGMGMLPEVQERIFEPFYTTKEVGKGTGLGLATVWHLVSRIGGKTTVDSEPGRGSSIHVWLPITKAKPPPPTTSKPAIEIRPAKTSASILFVEDDELVAKTISALLRRMGHQVTHQANGNDAWSLLLANNTYDLLLLDLDLPGISGLEIARRARAANFKGHILVASGRLSDADSKELDSLNVDNKLMKPFTPEALSTALQDCLAGKRRS